ncbi:prolactin-releasing peptide receptor-like [Saccoglossus kowalevskii]|uniref:Prolactin-releasing peptide receptor-like n=1 Tax=Saccoglossus kowalevskii TaxID=10224 RepID=A0ABM0GR84_SACKO|nr:PREDICTED: prolactin-releasing peptide receptor-like [Saccoglossus kowalevskii]
MSEFNYTWRIDFDQYIFDYFDAVYQESSSHPVFRGIFISVYVGIIVTGVFGNIMVCMAVKRNKNLHTPTYVFICNLSISDIAVCLFCLPLTLVYTLSDTWLFGEFLCYTVLPLQTVSVLVSTLTMTAIAIDRYVLILYPLKKRITLQQSTTIMVSIWLLSLSLSAPLIAYRLYEEVNIPEFHLNRVLCSEAWPSTRKKQIYTSLIFTFQYILPIIVILITYYRVWVKLRNRVVPGVLTTEQVQSEMSKKYKTNKMLMAVVVVFAVTWLPLNVWILLSDFQFSILDGHWIDLSYHICHSVAMISACINPFLYGRLSDIFYREFRQMVPCIASICGGASTNVENLAHRNPVCVGTNLDDLNNFNQGHRACLYADSHTGNSREGNSRSSPSTNPTRFSSNLV